MAIASSKPSYVEKSHYPVQINCGNCITTHDRQTGCNGQLIPILRQGSLINMPANYVPLFVDSLVSVSQLTKLHNNCIIFLEKSAMNISLTPSIITLLTKIHSIAVDENLILCTASLTAVDNSNTTHLASPLLANATYYQTAQLDTVAHVVRYFQ